jgi:hypothetical protein
VISAVQIEMEFVVDALPVELIGMNLAMSATTSDSAPTDSSSTSDVAATKKIGNPFGWTETVSLQGKTNFFEKRVGGYSKLGVGIDWVDQSFTLDASY